MKISISALAAILALSFGGIMQSLAGTWYWYGTDTAVYGGDGPWNNESLVWRSHPNNPVTNWVAGNTAQFNGSSGTVTLETNILISANMSVAADMTFDGPFSLMVSGGTHVTTLTNTATVNCAVVLLANGAFRYNYVLNGPISDDGTNRSIIYNYNSLILNGSNSFGGGVSLSSGALVIGNDHAIGSGTLSLGYDGAVLEAGGGARTITNRLSGNWNWRLYLRGTNNLTFTTPQTLQGTTAAPGPRYNVMETNTVLTFWGLVRDSRYDTPMTKEGPGAMVIEGAYDASYGTVVTGGTLIVNGATTAVKNNYGYRVLAGATLGGTGVINLAASGSTCTVQQAGALAPGAMSVGKLTINGPVSLAEKSIYKWEYKDGAGDLVDVNGALTLPAVATVIVSQVSGAMPVTPTLFTADTLAGPGAADVSGWVVQGVRGYMAQIQGTNVILQQAMAGTVLIIR